MVPTIHGHLSGVRERIVSFLFKRKETEFQLRPQCVQPN